jgi:hypothetical protein
MKSLIERIESNIIRIPEAGCWVWTAFVDKKGYGRINVGGKIKFVHRVVYEMLKGTVPQKHDIDHLCRNPSCCNPEHLEGVTRQTNVQRGLRGNMNPQKYITQCKNGHMFTEDNTYMRDNKNGTFNRMCKACNMDRRRISMAREKQQRADKRTSNCL